MARNSDTTFENPDIILNQQNIEVQGNFNKMLKNWLFLILIWIPHLLNSQINYSQTFTGCTSNPCNGWAWNIPGSMTAITGLGYTPCAVADPAARANLSAIVTTGNLSATSSLGTSSGEITT
ncbi:MAG: hypothetical protein H7X99_11815, partial [Saprospiraceae bacterium]|nr:hypothetical protein [Saprospiraceae bacterium]